MMMTVKPSVLLHPNLTVQAPNYDLLLEDPTAHAYTSPNDAVFSALSRYLPSNNDPDDFDIPVDAFSCDNFRMYEFKVRRCARARSHDWTECPFAHPGEKARRRDPRKHHYSGSPCPEFRKGACRKGDTCEHAHGVFECWLHPARYRTQPCKDGTHCRRRVCFFAHTPEQLRVLPLNESSYDSDSPPVSPLGVSQLAMRVGRMSMSPPSWGGHVARAGFMSLPSTPTKVLGGPGLFDVYEEEEEVMERVESGRDLRARMYAKLSKENSLDRGVEYSGGNYGPDVGWISELVN